MTDLSGIALERKGKEIFESLGFDCFVGRRQTRLAELFPGGAFAHGEHLELDFLIPCGDVCLIGEITSRRDSSDIRRKYGKFKNQITLLSQIALNPHVWELLGIPEDMTYLFSDVVNIKSFFVVSNFKKFDVDWELSDNIAHFFDTDFVSIEQYAKCTGKFCKNYFSRLFDLNGSIGVRRPLQLGMQNHHLLRTTNKIIAGGTIGAADVFSFEADPYELIPYAHVFRRDLLPDLASNAVGKYQRPLIIKKLEQIRSTLINKPNFMFPNSILVVLSGDCRYSISDNILEIPDTYGAMSVIDGQHRLFSYASEAIQSIVRNRTKIMVTAIKFREHNIDIVNKYSARTFIEINMNQTKIESTHLDAIAYEILGETTPKALAAHVLLKLNERNNALRGLFDTNQTKMGIIPTKTVLTELRKITDLSCITKIESATRGKKYITKLGHEKLVDIDFSAILTDGQIIDKYIICLERYFNLVARVFEHDWPKRNETNYSLMKYAKIIAAFIQLFRQFISEGRNWREVERELNKVRDSILAMEGLDAYTTYLLNPNSGNIPIIQESASAHFRFINSMRTAPGS
jgi:DGQHR domain-containing protein